MIDQRLFSNFFQIVTHNLFGGSCGQNPLIKNVNAPTCLCAETQAEADSRNITTDSTTTCDNPLPKPLRKRYPCFRTSTIRNSER